MHSKSYVIVYLTHVSAIMRKFPYKGPYPIVHYLAYFVGAIMRSRKCKYESLKRKTSVISTGKWFSLHMKFERQFRRHYKVTSDITN